MYHVFICHKKKKKKRIRAIYKFREGTVWKNNVIHANFNLGLCISFSFRNHGLEMFRYLCKASVVSMVLIQKKYSRNKYWTSQELIWLTYNNKGKSIRSNEGYWQVLLEKRKRHDDWSFFRKDYSPKYPYEDSPQSIGYGATISAP